MDFFKSVFSDDPSEPSDADENLDEISGDGDSTGHDPIPETSWSFGGLMKTLATKSETVIQTYRKDLEEFGSGLKMETAVIRDVASRAVADLPASLEIGAAVAQESLESVGQAIDDIGTSVWKSTAEIVAQGKDSILAADDGGGGDDDDNDSDRTGSVFANSSLSLDSKPYNRFESQLRAIQSSASTYLDEPEDSGNYEQWKLGFVLEDKSEEIEGLIQENGDIGEIYENFVPGKVDRESFWLRYFFKVHRLKEVEEARVKLVKRAISGEEEEMTWDFEDDDEEEGDEDNKDGSEIKEVDEQKKIGESSSSVGVSDDAAEKLEALKLNEKLGSEGKGKASSDSGKESDVSIVSRPEEEDFKWDEIEDVGSSDEGKEEVGPIGASSRTDPIKRLSNALDEDEDLSWDIEDEDDDDDDDNEPKKS